MAIMNAKEIADRGYCFAIYCNTVKLNKSRQINEMDEENGLERILKMMIDGQFSKSHECQPSWGSSISIPFFEVSKSSGPALYAKCLIM